MKRKIKVLFCISFLMITALGCGTRADIAEADMVNATALVASGMSEADEAVLQKAVDAANEAIESAKLNNAAAEEQISFSWEEFRDKILNDCDYDISEEELQVLYQDIKDSKILKGENRQLTGVVLNDYDQNGQTDMIVSVVYDEKGGDYTGGCICIFMNSKRHYYLHDQFWCYKSGDIFGDFGADIDHDGNTEVVFCVGGAENECVKFVVKLMHNEIERMKLPDDIQIKRGHGYVIKHDYGQDIWVENGLEREVYRVYYSHHCDEEVALKIEGQEVPEELITSNYYGYSINGYYKLALTEYQGEELLAGYEYIYLGDTIVGSAVFVLDWDENGEAYVKGWYVEDNKGKKYEPLGKIQKSAFDYTNIFDENEAGEEVKAYEEFITGKIAAHIDDSIYTGIIDGRTITNPKAMDKDGEGFYFEELIDEIIKNTIETEAGLSEAGVGGIRNVQYALIDCGNDGKKQLALRAYGLGIEGKHDDSTCTMVFDYKDGKIFMLYAVDAWSRSHTDLYKNGYVCGNGSSGASTNFRWEGIIGTDGVYHENFECLVETYFTLYEMPIDWLEFCGAAYPATFYRYSMSGKTIYAYGIGDDITEKERQVILDLIHANEEQMGVEFLTSDKAWELVEENKKRLGITEGMDAEENTIEWRVLPRQTALLQ